MYAQPCGRHCHSGSDWIEASHASERARPASLSGRPTQSPISGFSVLSWFLTGPHSPEKSIWALAITPSASVMATDETAATTRVRITLCVLCTLCALGSRVPQKSYRTVNFTKPGWMTAVGGVQVAQHTLFW